MFVSLHMYHVFKMQFILLSFVCNIVLKLVYTEWYIQTGIYRVAKGCFGYILKIITNGL
jgi:hypothetical protein